MHAMKIVVGAVAALVVGTAAAGSMSHGTAGMNAASPWAHGELYGSFGHLDGNQHSPMAGADARYDARSASASDDRSMGAAGRPFGDQGMTRDSSMGDMELMGRTPASDSRRLHQYVGG